MSNRICFVIIKILIFSGCIHVRGQTPFKYQSIEASQYINDTANLFLFKDQIDSIKTNGFNIEEALPDGFVKDGSVDYTRYLQKAIDQHKNIVFPPFPILINDNGLTLHSNINILFLRGAQIRIKPSSKSTFGAFNIKGVTNVSLFYPTIVGERFKHKNRSGEWGMGLYIYSAYNILVFSPKISACWGDAIYISGMNNKPSANIEIYNAFCDNNRRNGISVISARKLRVIDAVISNTNGTNPMSGIDIEPNNNKNIIDSLLFKDIYTINNSRFGLKIQLEKLLSSKFSPSVNIHIVNHISIGSNVSFALAPIKSRGNERNKTVINNKAINGRIIIDKPHWTDYQTRPVNAWNYGKLGPYVEINSPRIMKMKATGSKINRRNSTTGRGEFENSLNYLKNMFGKEDRIKIR